MAVEARQVNPFGYGVVSVETVGPAAYAVKSDSGLTYAVPVSAATSRKRQRGDDRIPASPLISVGPYTFLGEDISLHLHQQQIDLDRFVAQQTEKARIEIEERRKRHSHRTTCAIEESALVKKLRSREEELSRISKLNSLLEDRVKSLSLENQIWRDLAQTNEATANALRSNLEQVLAQAAQQHEHEQPADDAQSCCASNSGGEDHHQPANRNSMCRSCGRDESCVLLLPCRHLCLCAVCGSSVLTCPVCYCTKTASLHVNLSPS